MLTSVYPLAHALGRKSMRHVGRIIHGASNYCISDDKGYSYGLNERITTVIRVFLLYNRPLEILYAKRVKRSAQ